MTKITNATLLLSFALALIAAGCVSQRSAAARKASLARAQSKPLVGKTMSGNPDAATTPPTIAVRTNYIAVSADNVAGSTYSSEIQTTQGLTGLQFAWTPGPTNSLNSPTNFTLHGGTNSGAYTKAVAVGLVTNGFLIAPPTTNTVVTFQPQLGPLSGPFTNDPRWPAIRFTNQPGTYVKSLVTITNQ